MSSYLHAFITFAVRDLELQKKSAFDFENECWVSELDPVENSHKMLMHKKHEYARLINRAVLLIKFE